MKMLSWNIRGGLKASGWDYLTLIMKEQNPDMILLLETHLDEANSQICMLRFGKTWEGLHVAGNGRSGGIIFMWKSAFFAVKEIYKCSQMINVTISYNHSEPWLFTGLYASTSSKERKKLWELLNSLDTLDTPWLIVGDFNCIDKSEDKLGGKPFIIGNSLRTFKELCINTGLIDLSFHGMRYTWCNNRAGKNRIHARLDKAYANERWLQRYSRAMVKHLKRLASDHRPILLDCKPKDYPLHEKKGCSINGFKSEHFKNFKGVRQGDPLSPYLFIILQELLSKIINEYVEKGKIKPFKHKNLMVSHLLFADDIFIITKGSKSSCRFLLEALNMYCDLTNQRINRNKSELFFLKDCPSNLKSSICSLFRIHEGNLPVKYLGTMIDSKKLPVKSQEIVFDKVQSRLDNWASNNVSQARKVTLLNSVANSIPIHSLATTWINDKLIERHNKLVRGYLWSSSKKKKGAHLVNWKSTTMRKHEGGLGVKDLSITKFSIQAKRIIPFLNNEEPLWVKLLHAKYPSYHPWYYGKTSKFSWAFRSIHNAILQLRDGLLKQVGNGKNIRILEDPWISNIPIGKWPTFVNIRGISDYNHVSQLIKNND
ncbi:hypothetical protein Cni_G12941 [Canna indica]|uniref:Reverse transcriptase domain-containing protein n=1 Tax=Canna indica TaxID=4628 RepID=A0AAQ3KAW2_9LILI|nr:hypothetical protein Cni_G12941 [Canna indica]